MRKQYTIEDLTVVEFSPSQNCLHVESILEMIRNNQRVLMGKSMTDYIPIGIFSDDTTLQNFLDQAHERLREAS